MLPDRVSNPGPLTYESGALPIALSGLAVDFKQRMRGTGFIPFLGSNTIKTPLNQRPFIHLYLAMHSAIL